MHPVVYSLRTSSSVVYTRHNGLSRNDGPISMDYGFSREVMCVSRSQRLPFTAAAYRRESATFVCDLWCDTFERFPVTRMIEVPILQARMCDERFVSRHLKCASPTDVRRSSPRRTPAQCEFRYIAHHEEGTTPSGGHSWE